REPFARLHAVQSQQADKPQHDSRATSQAGDGPAKRHIEDLLAGMDLVHCSSKPSMVELRGLEPLTPTLPAPSMGAPPSRSGAAESQGVPRCSRRSAPLATRSPTRSA